MKLGTEKKCFVSDIRIKIYVEVIKLYIAIFVRQNVLRVDQSDG